MINGLLGGRSPQLRITTLLAGSAAALILVAPSAAASTSTAISVGVAGTSTGSSMVVGTGCPASLTATITCDGGVPVNVGTVDFFDGPPNLLPSASGILVNVTPGIHLGPLCV